MYFRYLCNNLPLEKGGALHLNKLESPSPKEALCEVWLKLARWVWKRRFLNSVNIFSQFRNYLPSEKGRALRLNKIESPSPKDTFCQVWLKFTQWFWRRRWKCEKFTTTTTTTTTDNGQILIRKAQVSLKPETFWAEMLVYKEIYQVLLNSLSIQRRKRRYILYITVILTL